MKNNKSFSTNGFKKHLKLMFNTYLVGPAWAKYLLACSKYSFLKDSDSKYSLVSSKKSIAMYQAKSGLVGLLAETDKNIFIRELVHDVHSNNYYVADRFVSKADNSAVFIPVFKGKFVVYSAYRYAQHKYCYEFLRSVENIRTDTDEDLLDAFKRCSGLSADDVRSIVYLGSVCPDSVMSHVKVKVYAVWLDSFNFESIVPGKSRYLIPLFNRNFNKVECLTLSDLFQYINEDKFFDGISLAALNLWIACLADHSLDSLVDMLKLK